MKALGPASVAGALFDLGPYPGLALDESAGRVHGHVFEVPTDDSVWRTLDAYEGYDPLDPEAGLFRREPCLAVFDAGGEVECQIYVYNGDLSQAVRLVQGRWEPT